MIQRERLPTLRGGKITVARTHGESVRLANCRTDLDSDRQIEIPNHVLDDTALLVVLLPEVGDIGRDQVEQLQHDGGHTAEMPGAADSFKRFRHIRWFDLCGELRGVDLFGVRYKDKVGGADSSASRSASSVPRIAGEVLVRTELGRIDENRDGGEGALAHAAPHETQVPVMQCPHGGHKPERLIRVPTGGQRVAKRPAIGDNVE